MTLVWTLPEGVRVKPDGTWQVGDLPVSHEGTLRYLKTHLVFGEDGAALQAGPQRLSVTLEGPPFTVVRLVLDAAKGMVRVLLDDGTEEEVPDEGFRMDAGSGRFECRVRGGRARAVLGRGAHQTLLEHAEMDGSGFVLRAGARVLPVAT
jgi:hypothetical protein